MKNTHNSMGWIAGACAVVLAASAGVSPAQESDLSADKPVLRDFIGINVHSGRLAQVDPPDIMDMYRPVTGLLRSYHPLNFDVARTSDPTRFPYGRWGTWPNWDTLYSSLVDKDFRINAAITLHGFDDAAWDDPAADARAYGRALAQHFGPTVGNGLLQSVQIGNEPGHISDAVFRTIFRNMAEGIREVDPAIIIVTPNVGTSPSGTYHKTISLFHDMTHLVDAYATHSYPSIQGWPTWERSYPEDPSIQYLSSIQGIIDWRNANDAASQVWVTEFGYDSTTKPNHTSGTFKDWIGVTDKQQAQYLVRSFLVMSEMELDRAYMFWYNDNDNPSVHGSSGLTRNSSSSGTPDHQPKPSYWAQRHLYSTLGDFRFSHVVRKDVNDLYIYAYEHESDPLQVIWAIWSPTGSDRELMVTLDNLGGVPLWADMMPLMDGPAPLVAFDLIDGEQLRMMVGESPTYLRIEIPEPAGASLIALLAVGLLRRRRTISR